MKFSLIAAFILSLGTVIIPANAKSGIWIEVNNEPHFKWRTFIDINSISRNQDLVYFNSCWLHEKNYYKNSSYCNQNHSSSQMNCKDRTHRYYEWHLYGQDKGGYVWADVRQRKLVGGITTAKRDMLEFACNYKSSKSIR